MILLKLDDFCFLDNSKNYKFSIKEKTENFVTADLKTFEKIPKHWQARDVIKKNK